MPPVITTVPSGSHSCPAPEVCAGTSLAALSSSPRTTTCGSSIPRIRASGSAASPSSNRSTSWKAPGFSVCADRTRPQAAAAATSCPVVAPLVTNTSRDPANASSANQSWTRANVHAVRLCAEVTTSPVPVTGTRTAEGTGSPPSASEGRSGTDEASTPAEARRSTNPNASGPRTAAVATSTPAVRTGVQSTR